MSKAVLISIRPEWCEKIVNGEKTIEVRKTRPKLETPFKCYIYCTKGYLSYPVGNGMVCHLNGGMEVIGEFVCCDIHHYKSEFWDDETHEQILDEYEPADFNEYGEYEYATIAENGEENWLCKKSCLSWDELRKYVGAGIRDFYGWHISDLVIYDKPMALSEFKPWNRTECFYSDLGLAIPKCSECHTCKVERPPQSWCYVEVLHG